MTLRKGLILALTTLLLSSCSVVHVAFLASDELAGRNNNTPGSALAQDYIIDVVSQYARGLDSSASGDAAFKQNFTAGTNILAVIPGTDLAKEYVIVGAHYDHVASCAQASAGDTICNGATDNAAGVSAVLEIGRLLAEADIPPRRSVILAFWDREEDGLLGSQYYVNNPLAPLRRTVAYVNFDILGANLLPSLRQVSFGIGAETGGPAFVNAVQSAIDTKPLNTVLFSAVFGLNRSDYVWFIGADIPTVFFSDSTGPCYHTTGDKVAVVDFHKHLQQIGIASNLVAQLASGSVTPSFDAGAPLATYDDAVTLNTVVQLAVTDAGRFTPAQQATIFSSASTLATLVAEGSANFDAADLNTMLGIAAQLVNLLTSGECDGFLPAP